MYYDEYETTSDLNEQLYYERLDVDREQAQFEAEGNEYYKRLRQVEMLRSQGRHDDAVTVCPHGHVGKLDGQCSVDDERFGEDGYRCYECGGVVSGIHGEVMSVS